MQPQCNATEMLNIEMRMLDIAIGQFENMGKCGSSYNVNVQREVGVYGGGEEDVILGLG